MQDNRAMLESIKSALKMEKKAYQPPLPPQQGLEGVMTPEAAQMSGSMPPGAMPPPMPPQGGAMPPQGGMMPPPMPPQGGAMPPMGPMGPQIDPAMMNQMLGGGGMPPQDPTQQDNSDREDLMSEIEQLKDELSDLRAREQATRKALKKVMGALNLGPAEQEENPLQDLLQNPQNQEKLRGIIQAVQQQQGG